MNSLPFLDLDAATQLYLPHEPTRARAQHRFAFRAQNGEEMQLLARLCEVGAPSDDGYRSYCVVLRPEEAEAERVFHTDSLYHGGGNGRNSARMTRAQAGDFSWKEFELSWADVRHYRGSSRCWSVNSDAGTLLWSRDAVGNGWLIEAPNTGAAAFELWNGEYFVWEGANGRGCGAAHEMSWLRQNDREFGAEMRAYWDDPQHEVHFFLDWGRTGDAQRQRIAFECRNGAWPELRQIAALALTIRLASLPTPAPDYAHWYFAEPRIIRVTAFALEDDFALALWRQALVKIFEPVNFCGTGVRVGEIATPLREYIREDALSLVGASPMSMHELLEAHLQLRNWARHNFSPENARILMDILREFNDDDAQALRESLRGENR